MTCYAHKTTKWLVQPNSAHTVCTCISFCQILIFRCALSSILGSIWDCSSFIPPKTGSILQCMHFFSSLRLLHPCRLHHYHTCLYMVFLCVCVCVKERERGGGRGRDCVSVNVCECVCVWECVVCECVSVCAHGYLQSIHCLYWESDTYIKKAHTPNLTELHTIPARTPLRLGRWSSPCSPFTLYITLWLPFHPL